MMDKKTVVCFGEVLWDVLPTGKIAGGAPMNVAYHLNNFGIRSLMVSKVGEDDLGKELLTFLQHKGISTEFIQKDYTFQTGVVNVQFDEKGSPSYDIVQPVAWDYIHLSDRVLAAVKECDLLVFGSLAARNETSRKTLIRLLNRAPLAVFDVNLRPPFYDRALLENLLSKSDIVKMNDEELDIIAGWYASSADERAKMEIVKRQFTLQAILMTKGKDGAVYLDDDGLHTQGGFPVEVQDTIGSGDSFLAGFISQLLAGKKPQECLAFACATGALVATHRGGTPEIDDEMVRTFIRNQ